MARLAIAILVLLVAGAYAQPPRRAPSSPEPTSPKVSPSPDQDGPAPAEKPVPTAAEKPAPTAAGSKPASPPANEPAGTLEPAATAAIDDAIQRARTTVRGRDSQKVLDNLKEPLTKVAEAKAQGVPVQIAVARSVTDVQKKASLNPQSRQAVLDAAYRVYTASPAKLATPSPSPVPSPQLNATAGDNDTLATPPEGAANATNATLPGDDALAGGNTTDAANATTPEAPLDADNTTTPLDADNTTPPVGADNATTADNATATGAGKSAGAKAAATPASPAPTKSAASLQQFVSSSLLAMLAAAVVLVVMV